MSYAKRGYGCYNSEKLYILTNNKKYILNPIYSCNKYFFIKPINYDLPIKDINIKQIFNNNNNHYCSSCSSL